MANTDIAVPKGELRVKTDVGLYLNGQAPRLGHVIGVPAGSLSVSGQAPAVAAPVSISLPTPPALTVSAEAPLILNGTIRAPPAGSLAVSGLPFVGLLLTGLKPTVLIQAEETSVTAEPGAATLGLVGQAPDSLNSTAIEVGLGRPEFNTFAPTLLLDSPIIEVPKGELHLVTERGLKLRGYHSTPVVSAIAGPEPATATLSVTGLTPTADETHNRLPNVVTVTLSGRVPTAGVGSGSSNTVFPEVGALSFTGSSPALEIIIPDAQSSLLLSGKAASVSTTSNPSQDETAAPGAGSLALTTYAPERPYGLLLRGYAPDVSGSNQNVEIGEGSTVVITGHAPTTFAENPIIEIPQTGSLSITSYAPTLEGLVTPPTGQMTLTGLQLRPLAYSWVISPDTGSLRCTGLQPNKDPKKPKGRSKKRKPRRLIVEIDNQFFEVSTPQEAEELLNQAAEIVEKTPDVPRPVIRIKTGSGKPSQSKVVQKAVSRTQSRISRAIEKAQIDRDKREAIDREIAILLALKLKQEQDDEEALLLLL